MDTRAIGLSTSSFGYSMGVTGGQTERKNPSPWTLEDFIDFAIFHGFGGIEVPLMRFIPDLDRDRLEKIRLKLRGEGMFLLLDAEAALSAEQIKTLIPIAKEFGSPIIRVKSSNILGLARKKLGMPWKDHVEHCVAVLEEVALLLREQGLMIALENHQDLDSNDLLHIIERVGSDIVGVNFDIGNAFASCEDPIVFAEKFGALIINIHLKDYTIYKSDEGFRLVRCPVGSGAVDFKTLIPLITKHSSDAKMVIELGAQEARNIGWRESEFWTEIQPRDSRELVTFFQTLEDKIVRTVDDSWKTLWEQGAAGASIVTGEKAELETSLLFISSL